MKTQASSTGVTIQAAARALRVDVSTLRRDIAAGCPVVELGSVGRGKGTLVDVDTVRRWRALRRGDVLPTLERALMKTFQGGIHDRLHISPGHVAYVLIKVYEHAFEAVTQEPLLDLHGEMRRLCAICLESVTNGEFSERREDGLFSEVGAARGDVSHRERVASNG